MKECKITLLGYGDTGKSALLISFLQGIFIKEDDPTIEDTYQKQVEIDSSQIMLEILDTAGFEHRFSHELYMKYGQAFLLVYSVTSLSSFYNLADIRERILREKKALHVPIILVGSKCDKEAEREVCRDQGENLARQ